MKTITTILTLALALPAAAQSFEELDPAAPAGTDETRTPEVDDDKKAELISLPSRYVGIDSEAYIQAMLSSFEMRGRARDPFGRHQDPEYRPPEPVVRKKQLAKYKPEPVTPFSDIVEMIPITAIIPSQEKFLVGGNSYSVGARLTLNTGKDKNLTVHVVAIDSNRVLFRHGVTNETAAHVLKLLPGGMQRGGGDSRPDGVLPADSNDTIDLSGASPNSLSSRR